MNKTFTDSHNPIFDLIIQTYIIEIHQYNPITPTTPPHYPSIHQTPHDQQQVYLTAQIIKQLDNCNINTTA
jgi:hypothetical protein